MDVVKLLDCEMKIVRKADETREAHKEESQDARGHQAIIAMVEGVGCRRLTFPMESPHVGESFTCTLGFSMHGAESCGHSRAHACWMMRCCGDW